MSQHLITLVTSGWEWVMVGCQPAQHCPTDKASSLTLHHPAFPCQPRLSGQTWKKITNHCRPWQLCWLSQSWAHNFIKSTRVLICFCNVIWHLQCFFCNAMFCICIWNWNLWTLERGCDISDISLQCNVFAKDRCNFSGTNPCLTFPYIKGTATIYISHNIQWMYNPYIIQ